MGRRAGSHTHARGAGQKCRKRMPAALGRPGARHLLDRWRQVAERFRTTKKLALFLDFDGTLVAFQTRPQAVHLNPAARRILTRLAKHPRLRVFIISGRRYADVRSRVKVPGVRCLGLHGWERGDRRSFPGHARALIEAARQLLSRGLSSFPGIWIEDKGLCLVLHYRQAPASAVRHACPLVRAILKAFEDDLRLMNGNKIWEVLSREVKGKGEAVRAVLGELSGSPLAIYLGDDRTDEAAFAVLRAGITVRVGTPRNTRARYYLRDPEEVRQFLERLETEIG